MSFFKTVKTALGIEIERPPYELIKKIGDNIEIRKYAPSKWVILILYSLFKREIIQVEIFDQVSQDHR